MAKVVFLIVDGMADDRIPQLNNHTPLSYADKPNLSRLLLHSELLYPSVLGKLAPESDSGVMADLGYDPRKYSTGRGWFECTGVGLKPEEGDISLRVNIGEVRDKKLISVRTYLSQEELKELEKDINEKVSIPYSFEFKAGVGYRAGLVIRHKGKKFSPYISNNEPGYKVRFYGRHKLSFALDSHSNRIEKIKPFKKEAVETANVLNDFIEKASDVLVHSQVYSKRKKRNEPLPNFLFLRDGAVEAPKMFDINRKYGARWAAVVGMPLEQGIAKAAGMHVYDVSEREDVSEDLEEKARAVIDALRRFDAVYIHVKQTDAVSHLGKFVEKYQIIEKIDGILIGKLLEVLDIEEGDTFVMTCDHATSSLLKRHINSNIPVLVSNKKFGGISEFSEEACRSHHEKRVKHATEIMPLVMKLWQTGN